MDSIRNLTDNSGLPATTTAPRPTSTGMAAAEIPGGGTTPPSPLHSPAPPPFPFSGRLHPFRRGPLGDARVQGPWEAARVRRCPWGRAWRQPCHLPEEGLNMKVPKMAFMPIPSVGSPDARTLASVAATHRAALLPPASYRRATHDMSGLTASIHTATTPPEEHPERGDRAAAVVAAARDKERHAHEDQERRVPSLVGPRMVAADDEGNTARRPLHLTGWRSSSRLAPGTTIGRHLSITSSSLSGSILDVSTNSNQFMVEETL